jgi:methylenetetrahydrofolate dehydrogenase (NADP+)/methenyltetrahydrofolate cyclohydrolase
MNTMETKIIKGDTVKDRIFQEVIREVARLQTRYHAVPGIAFIGFDCVPLAKYNIPLHVQMERTMGLKTFTEIFPNEATEKDVFEVIDQLNANDEIHAVVLLQPLPDQLNPVRIVNRIDPEKEVEPGHCD